MLMVRNLSFPFVRTGVMADGGLRTRSSSRGRNVLTRGDLLLGAGAAQAQELLLHLPRLLTTADIILIGSTTGWEKKATRCLLKVAGPCATVSTLEKIYD